MRSSLSQSFLAGFAALPPEIQLLARKNYKLWKHNPTHRSLQFKRIGSRTESYSVRVGRNWRAMGVKSDEGILWFWIGSHAEYDRLWKRM